MIAYDMELFSGRQRANSARPSVSMSVCTSASTGGRSAASLSIRLISPM
jgi:hypothetical protein